MYVLDVTGSVDGVQAAAAQAGSGCGSLVRARGVLHIPGSWCDARARAVEHGARRSTVRRGCRRTAGWMAAALRLAPLTPRAQSGRHLRAVPARARSMGAAAPVVVERAQRQPMASACQRGPPAPACACGGVRNDRACVWQLVGTGPGSARKQCPRFVMGRWGGQSPHHGWRCKDQCTAQ